MRKRSGIAQAATCLLALSAVSLQAQQYSELWGKNAEHGIDVLGERISVLNTIFDHYIGRPDIIGTSGITRWVGHVGIGFTSRYSLYHNIIFKGRYFHDFDIINVPSHNVVSNVAGTDMALHHHGQGARHNLYTNIYVGRGTRGLGGLKDSQTSPIKKTGRIATCPATSPFNIS